MSSSSTDEDEDLGEDLMDFYSQLLTDEFAKKYTQLKSDEERFVFALERVIQYPGFTLDSKRKQKDSEYSTILRLKGNESFKEGQYYEALEYYTESITHALDSSEELALAYANRSASLFEVKKYENCIEDIDRALNLRYPDRLKAKLYKRKGLCLTALGRPGADSSFQEALVWLAEMTLSKDLMDQCKSELKKLISAPCAISTPSRNNTQIPFPIILSSNSELPCASDAVALKYSEEFGRHLVATRKIKPGEILVVEKPYCMRVFTNDVYTHCSYCLQVSWTMIPCKNCVRVVYCSETCRVMAWDQYHEVECPVAEAFYGFEGNDDMLWMSMRLAIMATQKGKKLEALKQELINIDRHSDPRTKGFGADGKFHSDQYSSIYTLECNVEKCSMQTLLLGALWVSSATCFLARETKMFGEKLNLDTLTENPKVIFLGTLMLKHVHISCINMQGFGASRCPTSKEHGNAVMAVSNFLNHSCDPNTFKQWYPNCLAVYAAYPIEKGEQIFDNYGPHYVLSVKSERKNSLKHWNFNCACLACTGDWPLLDDLPSYKKQLQLTHEDKKTIEEVLQDFILMDRCSIKDGIRVNVPDMLNGILKVIEILFRLVQRPCKELASTVSLLEDLYALADAVFDYVPTTPSTEETRYIDSYRIFRIDYLLN